MTALKCPEIQPTRYFSDVKSLNAPQDLMVKISTQTDILWDEEIVNENTRYTWESFKGTTDERAEHLSLKSISTVLSLAPGTRPDSSFCLSKFNISSFLTVHSNRDMLKF